MGLMKGRGWGVVVVAVGGEERGIMGGMEGGTISGRRNV